jgi:hypothetical protein
MGQPLAFALRATRHNKARVDFLADGRHSTGKNRQTNGAADCHPHIGI